MTFFEIIRFFYRKRITLLAIFIITFIASAVILSTGKEIYGAHAVITSTVPEGSSGGVNLQGGLSSLLSGKGVSSATPEFMEYVDSFDTMRLARVLSRDPKIMHEVFSDQWDGTNQRWHPPHSARFKMISLLKSIFNGAPWHAPTAYDLQLYISDHVDISEGKDSTFYEIDFKHPDRDFAQYFLQSCIKAMDNILRQKRYDDLARREDYLRQRLVGETNNVIIESTMQQISTVISNLVYLHGRDFYAVTIIDPVFVYPDPVSPKPSFTIVISILLGIAVSIIFVFAIGMARFIKRFNNTYIR